jgi:hypothetical protein
MEQRPYRGTVGFLVEADCRQDLTGATNPYFLVKKPSGQETTWDAVVTTIDGKTHYLRYPTKAGDLNEAGPYRIHAHFTLGGWTGPGEVGTLHVRDLFS